METAKLLLGNFFKLVQNYKNKISIIIKMPSLKEEKLDEKNINDCFF